MIGVYRPGHSLLHRTPAGVKLLALIAAGVATIGLRTPLPTVTALTAAVLAYLLTGLGWRTALAQVRPLWPLLAVTAVLHVIWSGWPRAVVVVGAILWLVLLAALVTLTTRTTELVDVVETAARPLRRLGVPAERVGLMVALGIRCVPVVVALAAEVRDAQRARGLTASPRAFAVPLVVRSLRHADALAEALTARGVDD